MAQERASGPRSLWSSIAGLTLAMIPTFWVVHVLLLRWMEVNRSPLGALTAEYVVPVHAKWEPGLSLWALPAALVLLVFLHQVVPVLLKAPSRKVMLVSVLSFVAITTSVSMMDGFRVRNKETFAAIVLPLARTKLEYFGDVPVVERVGGPRAFLSKYSKPRLFEQLSLHSKTHPPGGAVFLWVVSRLFGPGAWEAAFAIIAFGSLGSILVFVITRELYGESAARAAAIVFLLTPNVVTYGATCMDSVFAVPPMVSLALFLLSQRQSQSLRRCLLLGALSGLALAIASFFTYAVVFLPVFLLLLTLRSVAGRGSYRLSRLLTSHVAGLLAFLAFYAALFLWAGYDPFATVAASMAHDAELVGTGYESWSTYWVFSFSNLAAHAAGIGFPTLALWAVKTTMARGQWALDGFASAFLWAWLLIGFSTLFTLEVERVWLFMAPFVMAPVGHWLSEAMAKEGGPASLRHFATALAANTFAAECLLYILW